MKRGFTPCYGPRKPLVPKLEFGNERAFIGAVKQFAIEFTTESDRKSKIIIEWSE